MLARVAGYIHSQKRGGSLLDVGCATGFFLSTFFSRSEWQRFGVELSSQNAEKAASEGIIVHQGDIHSAGFPENFFDVVSVLDAFYYFLEPRLELNEFFRILQAEGLLVLELPLAGSRIWRRCGRFGRLMDGARPHFLERSDHLFYYNPRSITHLLKGSGFRVQTVLPLPGNKQERGFQNLMSRTYFLGSLIVHVLSRFRIVLGPRFLVVATKNTGKCR